MRVLYALLVPAVILAFACSSEDPTGVSHVPIKPNFSISCAGVPNGGIVGVTMTPETATIDRSLNQTVRIDGHVFRDDPNTPGVQFYCEDHNVVLHFAYQNPPRVATAIFGPDTDHPQYTIAGKGTCPYNPPKPSCFGPANVVTSLYPGTPGFIDSTVVTAVP